MATFGSRLRMLAVAGLTAATLGGAALATSTPADAGWRGGWGPRYGHWGGGYRHFGGGALAAGIIGGLAVGALAASANPYYGYGGYAYPGYGYPVGYGGECYWVRRKSVDYYGNLYIRRVQVCD